MGWLHPIVGGEAATYVLLLLLAVAVLGLAANAPRAWPGPITHTERNQTSTWSRLEGWVRLGFGVAAWIAILNLIAPISRAEVAMLHSRARSHADDVKWDQATLYQRWDGAKCRTVDAKKVDLGLRVDSALLAVGNDVSATATDEERALAREHLLRADLDHAAAVVGVPKPPTSTSNRLPRWLIESVEMSTVLAYVHSNNVSQVLVAPAAARDVSAWRALGAMLAARGVEVCLVDPKVIEDGVRIRRFAFVRWARPTSSSLRVTFWALVEGRIHNRTTLHFKIDSGDFHDIELDEDPSQARLVFVCVGDCSGVSGGTKIADPRIATTPTPPRVVAAVAASGEIGVTAPIVQAKQAAPVRPSVRVVDPARLAWWSALLDSDDTQFDRHTFADELNVLGWQLPTTTDAGEPTPIQLAEENGRIVMWRGKRPSSSAAGTVVGLARVGDARLGVRTSLSWLAIPLSRQEVPAPMPPGAANATAGAQSANADKEPASTPGEHGVVTLFASDQVRMATIAVNVEALADQPISLAVLVRSMTYAAEWIRDPTFDEVVSSSEDRDESRIQAVPLLREEDLQELRGRDLRTTDLIAVALLGLHLWFAFRQRRK